MTNQIYKYQLTQHVTDIEMPESGHILAVQLQGSWICMWVLVDPKEALKRRRFELIGTGINFVFDERIRPVYIGTVQVNGIVWHCFETF